MIILDKESKLVYTAVVQLHKTYTTTTQHIFNTHLLISLNMKNKSNTDSTVKTSAMADLEVPILLDSPTPTIIPAHHIRPPACTITSANNTSKCRLVNKMNLADFIAYSCLHDTNKPAEEAFHRRHELLLLTLLCVFLDEYLYKLTATNNCHGTANHQ